MQFRNFKFLILIAFIIFGTQTVFANFTYNISLFKGTNDLNTVMQFDLENRKPVNAWNVILPLPENATVLKVFDSQSEIEEFDVRQGFLEFKTNYGKARTKDKIEVFLRITDSIDLTYKPLKFVDLSLPGFEDKETKVNVFFDNILSASPSLNFTTKYSNELNSAEFQGVGPVNLRILFGEGGQEYTHIKVFNTDKDLKIIDEFVPVLEELTGLETPFPFFSIVLVSDDDFEKGVNEFSAAAYETAGLIKIRESVFNERFATSTLLHELMHGFSEKPLKWTNKAVWFNEGMSSLIEYIVLNILNERHPEIFGNDIVFVEGTQKITIKSQSNVDELWNYYLKGETFMDNWSPVDSQTKSRRNFGYAFSSLFLRQFFHENGFEGLQKVFQELLKINTRIDDSKQATRLILRAMHKESLNPCFFTEKEDLEACVRELNEFEPVLPESINLTQIITGKSIGIVSETNTEIEENNQMQTDINKGIETSDNNQNSVQSEIKPIKTKKPIDVIFDLFNSIIQFFMSLLGQTNSN